MKILLVDDEALARRRLSRFSRELAPEAEILEADGGVEALRLVAAAAPDLVFLDVQMPDMSGFDVLAQLPERRFKLIFQTAFDEFALRAFEENAVDYLLKPYDLNRFTLAFQRAATRVDQEQRIAGLENALHAGKRYLDKVVVKLGGAVHVVAVGEIQALTAEGEYTAIRTDAGRELLSEVSLAHFEERLDPAAFLRVHRAAVVRVAAIKSLGAAAATLASGYDVPVSRRARGALKERLRSSER